MFFPYALLYILLFLRLLIYLFLYIYYNIHFINLKLEYCSFKLGTLFFTKMEYCFME